MKTQNQAFLLRICGSSSLRKIALEIIFTDGSRKEGKVTNFASSWETVAPDTETSFGERQVFDVLKIK